MHRDDFPMLKQDIIYLDNGATSLKPQEVIDSIVDYYENYSANAHRGDYDISYKVDLEIDNTRELVRDFIGARKKEEIVFTSGTTDSLNLIVNGFFKNNLERGDEILLTKMEHASNIMPWFRVAQMTGAIIKYIPLDDDNFVTLENLKSVITPNTKVISLAEITNVVGDVRPIKEICDYAHERNIFVVVDGAQSIPHKKCDVIDTDIDFLAFSAHKMCGPTGVGVLYAKYELMDAIDPVNLGGGMNESFDSPDKMTLKEIPTRLEAGTPNIAGIIGLGKAIKYLNKIGMEKISEYEKNLRDYLISKLVKIPHIDILNLESDSGIVAFNVEGIFSEDVAYFLNKYGVCVRAGSHCAKLTKDILGVVNSLRVSLYFYNTESEIDNLVELLKDKEKIMKEMF